MKSTSDNRIRVMLVDDHPIVVDGLRDMMEKSGEFEVIGQARDGDEAIRLASKLMPDLIIMDVLMPNTDGVEACREIMKFLPDTRVIMLTASTDEDAVIEAMAAGATGYLQKVSGRERLLATIRAVAAGELRVPADVVMRTIAGFRAAVETEIDAGPDMLTQRELEILSSFARGTTYAEIAERRGVKTTTIRNAIYGIQGKLRVKNNQELVIWAMRNGLLDDFEPGV